MIEAMGIAAARAKATPVPGVGEQVATDLKDTVSTAAETAGDWLNRMPQMVSRLLLALAVLVADTKCKLQEDSYEYQSRKYMWEANQSTQEKE